jgi:hypothetical protein
VDSSLIAPIITGSGVAGVFCVLFITGRIFSKGVVDDLKAELAEYKAAVAAERVRADTAVAGNSSMRDIFEAIRLGRDLGDGSQAVPQPERPQLPGATP